MKARLNPTEINLKELPQEGRDYTYSEVTGELHEALHDLIGTHGYRVQFHLKPVGNAFHLQGQLETTLTLQCSRCATEFDLPVQQLLHEVLVIQPPLNKGDQVSKTNHAHEWEPTGPDYLILDSDLFRVGDYVHEIMALAEPMRPDCGQPACEEIAGKIQRDWLSFGEPNSENKVNSNPFKALENFKLKS